MGNEAKQSLAVEDIRHAHKQQDKLTIADPPETQTGHCQSKPVPTVLRDAQETAANKRNSVLNRPKRISQMGKKESPKIPQPLKRSSLEINVGENARTADEGPDENIRPAAREHTDPAEEALALGVKKSNFFICEIEGLPEENQSKNTIEKPHKKFRISEMRM